MPSVDLNADLGEGAGSDAELMPLVTSANIACGAHAGDTATMRVSMTLALRHGVAIGAHPGFADRANFGRLELPVTPEAAASLVVEQLGLAQAVANDLGVRIRHVKLHGALYNLAVRSREHADAIAAAVHGSHPALVFVGLAGSQLLAAGRARGLKVASEVFADRTYQPDGSLTPRSQSNALLKDPSSSIAQVLGMVRDHFVRCTDGTDIPVVADTICVHGDGPHAVALARGIRAALEAAGVSIRALAA